MRRRGLTIALALSLVANLFVIGAVGGLIYVRARASARPPAAAGNPLVRAADDLSPADRNAFHQMLRRHVEHIRPMLRDSRQSRREALGLFSAATFDRAAAGAAMARSRADDQAARAELEDAILDFTAQLSPPERAAFAEGFRKRALARWFANHPNAAKPTTAAP